MNKCATNFGLKVYFTLKVKQIKINTQCHLKCRGLLYFTLKACPGAFILALCYEAPEQLVLEGLQSDSNVL